MKRGLHSEDSATASVVGTLLGLTILIMLVSVIVNGYIPLWMEEKEAEHQTTAQNDFLGLKSRADQLTLDAKLSGSESLVSHTGITLGTKGVGIFSPDSTGDVSLNSYRSICTISTGSGVQLAATGNIYFTSSYTYYEEQELIFENGAIIAAQGAGEWVIAGPGFNLINDTGNKTLFFTMTSLLGQPDSAGGSKKVDLVMQTKTFQNETTIYPGTSPEDITITIESRYLDAWEDFFVSTLRASGFREDPGLDFYTTRGISPQGFSTLNVILNDIDRAELGFAGIFIRIEHGFVT